MLELIRKFFFPFVPDDPEKRSLMRLLQTIQAILALSSLAAAVITVQSGYTYLYAPIGLLLIFLAISFFFLRRGILFPAQILPPTTLFILITYVIITGYGLHDINLIGYAVVINIASLTLGLAAAFWFSLFTVVALFAVGYAEMNSILVSPTSSLTLTITPLTISLFVLASAFIQRTLITRLNENVRGARENEEKQQKANAELRELQATLEARVETRTAELAERGAELEKISTNMQKRAAELQAVALVGRAITSIDSLDELLPRITSLVSQQFGFYHVGIFLIDQTGNYAELIASNSPGGQKMISKGHKLKVGEAGIVGYVSSTGRPRISEDVGTDAVFFNNPDLPETHSEIALPLKISGKVIGVLDVQSTSISAFGNQDIELISILADQVSVAIQNAQRFEETQESIATARAISRQYIQQEWQSITEEETVGYRYSQAGIQPIINTGEITTTSPALPIAASGQDMLIPIKLHDQTIGLLRLQSQNQRKWDQDTLDIAEAVAERVALAVENARLLERSQFQAARERTVSEITARIGASVNMRNVLQTAVEELGRILPGSNVIIQMESKK